VPDNFSGCYDSDNYFKKVVDNTKKMWYNKRVEREEIE
jgi:hypothetical protein